VILVLNQAVHIVITELQSVNHHLVWLICQQLRNYVLFFFYNFYVTHKHFQRHQGASDTELGISD